jgi:hypothetical protein
MSIESISAVVARHGATSKSVRAICASRGWRHTKLGAPAQWYEAWRSGLGVEFEHALVEHAP